LCCCYWGLKCPWASDREASAWESPPLPAAQPCPVDTAPADTAPADIGPAADTVLVDIDLAGIDPAADIAHPGTATLDRDFAPAPRLERLPAEPGEYTEGFGSRGTPLRRVYSSAHTSKGEARSPLSRDRDHSRKLTPIDADPFSGLYAMLIFGDRSGVAPSTACTSEAASTRRGRAASRLVTDNPFHSHDRFRSEPVTSQQRRFSRPGDPQKRPSSAWVKLGTSKRPGSGESR
jgi:hypothetical protein